MLTWFILAQVMGVVTIIFDFITYQVKDNRSKYLLVYAVGSVFWSLMFVFMGLYTGFETQTGPLIAASFGVIRSLIFWWIFLKETKKRKIAGKVVLYIFLAIALVVGIKAINDAMKISNLAGMMQIFAMVCALLFVIGQYLPGNHYVRIFQILYSISMFLMATPLNILDGDFRWNIMGMVIETGKIAAIAVFYLFIYYRNWLNKKLVQIKTDIATQMIFISDANSSDEEIKVSKIKLEALVARMVRYKLSAADKSKIKTIDSAQLSVQEFLDDEKIVQEAKTVLTKQV